MGSTRLPGKVLLPLGGHRIIDLVRKRCEEASSVDQVVFTIGDEAPNEAITEWCERNRHSYVIGPEEDLLARHRLSLDRTGDDTLVRVTGDCPFVPPQEIDRLLREFEDENLQYVTNVMDEMPVGVGVDVISRRIMEELAKGDETHPVKTLRENSAEWDMKFSASEPWRTYGEAHIAVDMPSDYWTLIDAIEDVGTDPSAVARWVAEEDI